MAKIKLTHSEIEGVWGKSMADLLTAKSGAAELSPQAVAKIYNLKRQYIDSPEPGGLAFVYFVSCGEFVKVGMTTNIHSRIKTLQTAAPGELTVLRMICCKDYSSAQKVEKAIQRLLKDQNAHKHGEWFHGDSVDHALLSRQMSKRFKSSGVIDPNFAVQYCLEALADPIVMALTQSKKKVTRALEQARMAVRLDM